ncbi:hypothetical protein NA57DRAFT_12405, partial [Rhizodiscina lignyota]
RKRCRITFSCTNCRRSKQRCDRENPCRTCVIRGKQDTCQYEEGIFDARDNRVSPVLLPSQEKRQRDSPHSSSHHKDLSSFGYSNLYDHNALGILKKLQRFDVGTNVSSLGSEESGVFLPERYRDEYKAVLQRLPCQQCTQALVAIFFKEFNWNYSLLDDAFFDDELRRFYDRTVGSALQRLDVGNLVFPTLLFQVIALALQFMPSEHERCLDEHGCIDASRSDGGKFFSGLGARLWTLFEKNATCFLSVQASFLRVCWLKNSGRVVESWHGLAQVAMDAQDIGLHREDGRIEATDAETAVARSWEVVLRRRLIVNLFLWETQMAMILGKSINLSLGDFHIIPPVDTAIPKNRTTSLPFARRDLEKPNSFTARLLEYRLQVHLPRIIALEADGPFPKDYTKVEKLHQEALDYIDSLPPIYRFENPDTSFDAECQWLPAQREFLCTVTWLFVLLLHRPYIFSIARSRTEIVKASIEMLSAQQRILYRLRPNQYRFFILSFISVEASISLLAVFIAYPSENKALL